MHKPQRPILSEQLSGHQRISRPGSRVDIQIGQRRRQAPPLPSPNTATAAPSPHRCLVQPPQPGQYHPLHLPGNPLAQTGRLRGNRRYTVRGQIENQLAQHKRITPTGPRARCGERRVGPGTRPSPTSWPPQTR